jgi:hypothetical protein
VPDVNTWGFGHESVREFIQRLTDASDVRTAADEVTTATANLGTAFAQGGCIGGGTLIGQCWHFFAPGNLGRPVVTVTVRLCGGR